MTFPTTAALRVAIYARYSSDRSRDESLEDQIRVCRAYAERHGWIVVEVLQDAAISGASSFRAGYQTLLERVRERRFDIVVSEALDRLSRDQSDVAGLYKRLSFAGVAIHTVSEGLVSELHVGLKGTMNALFLRDLAAKTHRGLRGRVEAGKSGGGLSYGYELVRQVDEQGEKTRGDRRIHAEQHQVVTRIFTMFAAGSSPIAIAKALNLENIPGPFGHAWRDTTIRGHRQRGTGILRNELYIGRIVWNRMNYVKDPETGKRISRMNPVAQWVIKDVPHLRLLDDDLWAAVQRRLGSSAVEPESDPAEPVPYRISRRPQHILTGRVFCGVCEGTMSNSGQDYLTCTVASRQGICTNTRSIKRHRIEAVVVDALRTRLMQPEACAEFSAAFKEECARTAKEASGADATRRRELEKVRQKLDELVEAIASGLRSTTLQTKLAQLEAREAELERDLKTPCHKPTALPPDLAAAYQQELEQLGSSTDGVEGTETRELIRGLIERVIITPAPHGKGSEVELVGTIAAMIDLALNAKTAGKPRISCATDGVFASSVQVVAGKRNHRDLRPLCIQC